MDLWVIRLSGSDIDVFERPVEAWTLLGTVHPDDSVLGGSPREVGQVDIGPSTELAHYQG